MTGYFREWKDGLMGQLNAALENCILPCQFEAGKST